VLAMPPSAKIDKATALQAAYELAREEGLSGVTARNIARRLGCSTQPIFRIWDGMDALKRDLFAYANAQFAQYLMQPGAEGDEFFTIGFRYVQYASEEPNLFKMMFMSGAVESDSLIELFTSDADNIEIMKTIPANARCTSEQIKDLFVKIAIFTHGIASLVATNDIPFTPPSVSALLVDMFRALSQDATVKEKD
jgi:AcrR family transcriptional regulator